MEIAPGADMLKTPMHTERPAAVQILRKSQIVAIPGFKLAGKQQLLPPVSSSDTTSLRALRVQRQFDGPAATAVRHAAGASQKLLLSD